MNVDVFATLLQPDGEDDLKKRQLMELAIINGTYRDTSKPATSQAGGQSASSRKSSHPATPTRNPRQFCVQCYSFYVPFIPWLSVFTLFFCIMVFFSLA